MTRCTSASGTSLALAWVATSASYWVCWAKHGCAADIVATAASRTSKQRDFIKPTFESRCAPARGESVRPGPGFWWAVWRPNRAFLWRRLYGLARYFYPGTFIQVLLPGIMLCRARMAWNSALSSRRCDRSMSVTLSLEAQSSDRG